jgi:hypothetical protein
MYVGNGLFMNERAFPRLLLVTPMASTVCVAWGSLATRPSQVGNEVEDKLGGKCSVRIFGVLDCLKTDAGLYHAVHIFGSAMQCPGTLDKNQTINGSNIVFDISRTHN